MSQRRRELFQTFGAVAAFMLLGAAILTLTRPIHPPTPDPLPFAVGRFNEHSFYGGWQRDDEAVAEVEASLPEPRFRNTPAFRSFRGKEEGTVLLSDFAKRLRDGNHVPVLDQGNVGSCVANAIAAAVCYLIDRQFWEAWQDGGPQAHCAELVAEAIYGLARHEIGKDKIRGDGAVTAYGGRAVREYGVIPRGQHGKYDLTRYDEKRCRAWGKTGLPDDLEPVARQSPVNGVTMARTAEEVARAIRQGYAVAVGSDIGFGNNGPWKRDKDGFLRASGSWGHCMAVIGVRAGSRKGFLFLNSWGSDWISGPTGIGDDGKAFDIPPGSFWVDWKTADRMFAEGDCVIFSDAAGFPVRDPLDDFWIFAQPRGNVAARQLRLFGGIECSLAY